MTATGRTSLATAHRMVDRVHRDAAVVRTTTEPARSSSFAERNVLVVDVRNLSDRRVAILVNLADLTGRQAHLRVIAVFCHENGAGTG